MIDIVLATYNPSRYLIEQVSSILYQTYIDKVNRIILVDDGSSDESLDHIQNCVAMDPRIEVHENTSKLHGAKYNFAFGLTLTTADYIMTCDQDDVWFVDKIEMSLDKIHQLEKQHYSRTIPLLVATDVTVTDEKLNILHQSFFEYLGCNSSEYKAKENLVMKNITNGCTMIFNQSLLNACIDIPEESLMHDWWLLIVSAYKGDYFILNKPTMFYRQHGGNCLGASKNKLLKKFLLQGSFSTLKVYHRFINDVLSQASKLHEICKTDDTDSFLKDCRYFNGKSLYSKFRFLRAYRKDNVMKIICFLFIDFVEKLNANSRDDFKI